MKRKKALILDLDGTLFNSRKEISVFNCTKIAECMMHRYVVIIATARPLRTVISRLPSQLQSSYIVVCNGAWITRQGVVVYRDEIRYEEVRKICRMLAEAGYTPMIEANDSFYSDRIESWFEGEIYPLHAYKDMHACKVLAYRENGIDSEKIDQFISDDFTKVITDTGTLLQISRRGCTKVKACSKILDNEGIRWEDAIAFGDDTNDLPVFEMAGVSIAMKNATRSLQQVATWITDSNDEDGVGKAIEKYILGGAIPG